MDKVYGVKYKVEAGKFTKDDLKQSDAGGTDELLWASIINVPGGGLSVQWASTDGKGTPLSMNQVFKAWAILATHLKDEQSISFDFREIATQVHERVKKYVLTDRDIK